MMEEVYCTSISFIISGRKQTSEYRDDITVI